MAEPGAGLPINDRRLIIITAVVVGVISLALLFGLRGCSNEKTSKAFTTIYSNLDLKDAASVIARLKDLKIPYEIKDEGKAIAVQKNRADEARLGLAEKNLPLGGVVGWEIFDASKLGATDFDRRIQLIRAISGELSRTISRIRAISDARVQIVLPETKLFEAAKAPVTAAVFLRLKPGETLNDDQINGIIHLVASSVENLQPQNVTIIDEFGRILSSKIARSILKPLEEITVPTTEVTETPSLPEKVEPKVEEEKISKEVISVKIEEKVTKEVVLLPTAPKIITPEEREMMIIKSKEEFERQLSARAQELINQFYPPNAAIVKVSIEMAQGLQAKAKSISMLPKLKIKKVTAIILVDNRFDLTPEIKKATYSTVAAAIGYNKKRGDKVILRKVPFHLAVSPPLGLKPGEKLFPNKTISLWESWGRNFLIWIVVLFSLFIIVILITSILKAFKERREPATATPLAPLQNAPRVPDSIIADIKSAVEQEPGKVANILREWLTEE